jgi:tetratricopeptide (TPR) repeat protein
LTGSAATGGRGRSSGARKLSRLAAAAAIAWLSGCASAPPQRSDGFPLDPREGLAGPFDGSIRKGWRELAAGNAVRAEAEFRLARGGDSGTAGRIGTIEALVVQGRAADAVALCPAALAPSQPTAPLLSACGEAFARAGQAVVASDLYARAVELAPGRSGLRARAEELRSGAVESLLASARGALSSGRWNEARAFAAQALARDPGSGPALWEAGEVECAAGERRRALDDYRSAIEAGGIPVPEREQAGRLALELEDYAVAVSIFDALAAEDPRYREAAAGARLDFRIANWPEPERRAARSRRLTRAGAARLVWWSFPEVREARVTASVVATDALDRGDSQVVMRSISLGLLDVDPETHRARPDGLLTRGAAARLLLRLAGALLPPGPPPACLQGAPEGVSAPGDAIRMASRCGLLSESGGSVVSGRELTQGLDRLRSLVESREATHRD